MKLPGYVSEIADLQPLFDRANHVDVKVAEGDKEFRAFLANVLNYQPCWVTFLYGVRSVFVRFLGLRQNGIPKKLNLKPEQVAMQPNQSAGFFKVNIAKEDSYWASTIDDKHLRATILAVKEPLTTGHQRFYLITIVHYHKWTGPVYFNIIRLFHHLVVSGMLKAGVRPTEIALVTL